MERNDTQSCQNSNTTELDANSDHDAEIMKKILAHVGEMGLYQKLMILIMMLFGGISCLVYYAQMFTTATPEHHWCRIPELYGLSMELRKNLSAPGAATGNWDRCMTFDINWTQVLATLTPPPEGTPLVPCAHGWEFELSDIPYATVTTERFWVCDHASIVPTAQSIFYVGAVIGEFIFGWIADRYGRVPALVATNLAGGIGGVATIFTSSAWDFMVCRFIVGLSFNTSFMLLYVLVLEYVGVKYRTKVANLSIACSYTVAGAIMPWLAYYIANWRTLLWITALPMFIVILAPWTLPESIQWLVSKGHTEKAVRVLRRFEYMNRTTIPNDLLNGFKIHCDKVKQEEEQSILELFRSKQLRIAMLFLIFLFMGSAMDSDGLTRLSDSFGLSFFSVITFHGIFEFLSFMLVVIFLDRLGRRRTTSGSAFLGSIVILIALFVPEGVIHPLFIYNYVLCYYLEWSCEIDTRIPQAVLAIAARFFTITVYTAVVQWGAEIIPTPFRATGMSILHMFAFTANTFSPFVAYSKRVWNPLPMVIFTVVAFLVGGFSLALPETKGLPLPQTRADGERVIKEHSIWRK